jgi:hypothetical protein
MKRSGLVLLLLTFAVSSVSDAQKRKAAVVRPSPIEGKIYTKCPSTLNNIGDCPDTGCGPAIDPFLNKRKNIRSDDKQAEETTLQTLMDLPDPVAGYRIGDSRETLARFGEGKKVKVVAFALIARKGSRESCNCALMSPADTDNNIVLVDPSIKNPTLVKDEENSMTAELTPRVRLDHPGLAGANLQALIFSTPNQALLVRVTGLLMFDSEHSLGHHLRRHNNWELHPVLALDYCPKARSCKNHSDENWKSLDR